MVNRTVQMDVKLLAQDYFAGLKKMQEETKKTSTTAEQAFNKQKAAFTDLGHVALGASVVFTGAFVAMVKASADFEQRMSQVQALSKATAGQMDKLRGSAFTAGKAFGLSATQVADAEIELTKAGVSVRDIIGGALPGALALAAAGQIDVAKATEIASNAMTEFSLKGKDVPHIADLLAAGADKSVASVESLGDALNQSGLVAAQFGLSVDDTVGVLTAFSKEGLNGSDAGTSFKTMLLSLASPSKQAQKYLDEYNITAYDSQGAFVGITKLADQLKSKLGGLSDAQRNAALSTIFGTDAIRAANVLYKDGGAKLQAYINANNEAGFAADQARKKLDNLKGDVQNLGAAFQNDLIKSGTGANEVLRGLTKGATSLLDVVGDIPGPLLSVGAALTAAGAGASLLGVAALVGVPKLAEFEKTMVSAGYKVTPFSSALDGGKRAIGGLRSAAGSAATFFGGPWGLALAAGGAALSVYDDAVQRASASTDVLDAAAKRGAGGIDVLLASAAKGEDLATVALSATADWSTFGHVTDDVSKNFAKNIAFISDNSKNGIIGSVFDKFTPQAVSTIDALQKVGTALAGVADTDAAKAAQAFEALAAKTDGSRASLRTLLTEMGPYESALEAAATKAGVLTGKETDSQRVTKLLTFNRREAASATGGLTSATTANAQALNTMAGSAADASVDISTLSKTIAGFGSATLDARSAERAFHQAVDDATAAAKNNAGALNKNRDAFDDTTKAGRDHEAALDGIASAATNAASKIFEETGIQGDATKAIKDGREALIRAATQMGLTRTAAKKLADQLGLIPSNVDTAVGITGYDAAKADLARLKELVNGIPRFFYINPKVVAPGTGTVLKKAAGGSVAGSGAKGVDSVPAMLAPGEHVFTAKDVDRMGGQAAVYSFRRNLMAGIDGYALGGAVAAHGGHKNTPVFTQEGPDYYSAAYKYFRKYATKGPYNTSLSPADEKQFEAWVEDNGVPFDVLAKVNDYDMRGYWRHTKGRGWHMGEHFPDTYKTPYDTSFSRQSQYATRNNPFDWSGDDLINTKTKQVVFRAGGGAITGPGAKGADSVLAMLAPGEHVFTAAEVDRMGGQRAVSAFRKGLQGYSAGGAIGDANNARVDQAQKVIDYTTQLKAAKTAAAAAKKTADHTADIYSGISSKKADEGRKKAAKSASPDFDQISALVIGVLVG